MALLNPYLDFFHALPTECRRAPNMPPSAAELLAPNWLAFKAAVARHFAWAVPTEEAISAIRQHTSRVVEIGAGGGYWTWLMRQSGIVVEAFDVDPPPFTWSEVLRGNERRVGDHPDKALFLCWPPWATGMATNALVNYAGEQVVYVGEWMGGSAEPNFFSRLVSSFECIASIEIPQWAYREDRLMIFRRHAVPRSGRVGYQAVDSAWCDRG